jgi:hypothetical protein
MSSRPATTRTAPPRGSGAAPWPVVSRWLVALAVLAGFVAMHGLSADHDVHALAALPGGHHAPAQPGAGAAVTPAPTAVGAGLPAWQVPGSDGHGHAHDGCLVMLATSVLALVLALLLARRSGAPLSTPLRRRVGRLVALRAPPLRASPGFAALGILRT